MSDRELVKQAIAECDDIVGRLGLMIERFDTNTNSSSLLEGRAFLVEADRKALADLIEALDTVRACRIHRI